MDALQAVATSIGVIGLFLLMVLLMLHFFGPQTAAWIHCNREEKIGFSKNRIYNANGYLIQSGSELLLNSTGSFKRFESIDRDCKPDDQATLESSSLSVTIPDVPPQPLRPAPKSPTHCERKQSLEKSPHKQTNTHCNANQSVSIDISTVIPRPLTKRQFSSPANCGVAHINLSDVVAKISNGPKSCTNPFLNGSLSISEDDNSNSISFNEISKHSYREKCAYAHGIDENLQKNPFTKQQQQQQRDDISFFAYPSNGNIVDSQATNSCIENTEKPSTLIEFNEKEEEQEEVKVENSSNTSTLNDSPTFSGHIISSTSNQIHNRSLSDAGSAKINRNVYEQLKTNPFNAQHLHKTVSDTDLEQYSTENNQHLHSLDRTSRRQSIQSSYNDSANNSQSPLILGDSEINRAMSCESINSESSVRLADLEQQQMPTVTGQLCVGLQYDKNTLTDEGIELVLTVMEAKELIGPADAEKFDTFVRIFMRPDETAAQQTKVFRNSKCPSYNETISFWLSNKGPTRRSLMFHLYHSGNIHTLIGETEFQIGDVRRPITTWLTLSDSRHNNSPYGELMFSLSYLPTAERLTVVVVKARNLRLSEDEPIHSQQNVFVKVYLQKNDKKVSKKKTTVKRADSCPIFNEAMIFSVPPYMLNAIQIRLTVVSSPELCTSTDNSNTISSAKPIGPVIVGCSCIDKGSKHWNQMLISLRKPVAMWHAIKRTSIPNKQTG